jgi:sortase A
MREREPDTTPGERKTRSGNGGAGFLCWCQWLLAAAGLAMLGWSAAAAIDAAVVQGLARQSLSAAAVDVPVPVSSAVSTPPATEVARGAAVAVLSIPRIALSSVVLQGSDARTLRRGPGHVERTAWPGGRGNIVIAGHRDTFFRPLRNIRLGDDIFLDAPQGQYRYRVASLRVVTSQDVTVLEPTGAPLLTLITCYPFRLLGHAPDRFIVRATLVENGVSAATGLSEDRLRSAPVRSPD